MRAWLKLWAGHIFGCLAVLMLGVSGYFGWLALRGNSGEEIWWAFIIAVIALLLCLILAAIAAYTFNSHEDRWYARNQRRVAETPLTPAGDVDPASWRADTQNENEAAHEAHSAREDGI